MPVDKLRVLITRERIAAKVAEMGQRISQDFAGEPVVLIGVLKGATIFLADLARQITLDVSFDFIAVSSYGNAKQQSGEVKLVKDVDRSMEGRNIILVEDILDTGLTLTYHPKHVARAPAEVAEDCGAVGQGVAAHRAHPRGLRGFRDSRRVCGGIRA